MTGKARALRAKGFSKANFAVEVSFVHAEKLGLVFVHISGANVKISAYNCQWVRSKLKLAIGFTTCLAVRSGDFLEVG